MARNTSSFIGSVPLGVSIGVHIALILFLVYVSRSGTSASQALSFDIVSIPPETLAPVDLTQKTASARAKGALAKASGPPVRRKIFGVTMDSVVVGEPGQGDVVLPVGDTLMKKPDTTPIPLTDLTEMPVLIKEIKVPYPPQAMEKRIEGKVVLELLIDVQGHVISAQVIRPAGYGFDEAAMEAVKGFLFTPARIRGRIVPVRITYTYTFVLG